MFIHRTGSLRFNPEAARSFMPKRLYCTEKPFHLVAAVTMRETSIYRKIFCSEDYSSPESLCEAFPTFFENWPSRFSPIHSFSSDDYRLVQAALVDLAVDWVTLRPRWNPDYRFGIHLIGNKRAFLVDKKILTDLAQKTDKLVKVTRDGIHIERSVRVFNHQEANTIDGNSCLRAFFDSDLVETWRGSETFSDRCEELIPIAVANGSLCQKEIFGS